MIAATAAALLVPACGGDDPEASAGSSSEATEDILGPVDEASGEPVTIGVMSDGDNPTADNQVEIDAVEAGVDFLNERRGGIGGRPIELVSCDSQLDPAKTTDCANQMVQEDVVAVVMGALGSQEPAWQVLHDAGIPMLWGAANLESIVSDTDTSFVLFNAHAALIDLPLSVAEDNDVDKVTVVIVDVPAAKGTYETEAPPIFEDAGIELDVIPVPLGTADMTSVLRDLSGVSDTAVHVVGNDAFCIAAFNAMQALAFSGPVSTNSLCITDATRTAIPGSFLEGISFISNAPVGVDDPSTELYQAVAETYGDDIDATAVTGATSFMGLNGLHTVLDATTGDLSPETVAAALRSMEWSELPGSGGLHFRCNGKAIADAPALCVRGALRTTLDAEGQARAFEPIYDTEIED